MRKACAISAISVAAGRHLLRQRQQAGALADLVPVRQGGGPYRVGHLLPEGSGGVQGR